MDSRVSDQDVRSGARADPKSTDTSGRGEVGWRIDPLWAWAIFGSVVIIMTTMLFTTW